MTLKLWELTTFTCSKTFNGHEHTVSDAKFTPIGDFIVSASRDKTIRIWEVATGYCKKTLNGHEDWVRILQLNNDGSYIASGSND